MIKDQIVSDVKQAMRAKDSLKLGTLRLITAAIKQVEVDERVTVDDARLLVILDKMCRQRKESIAQFETANRTDLIQQELFELDIIKNYLPTPLTSTEVSDYIEQTFTAVSATKMSDMGKVMEQLKPLLQGRTDMSKVSMLVKAKLSAL